MRRNVRWTSGSSTVGALETLTYAGRPVESLAEFRLTPEELAKFEALVLPEVEVLSDAQAEVIRNWVKGGGTLVASYKCGLRDEKRQARSNFSSGGRFWRGLRIRGAQIRFTKEERVTAPGRFHLHLSGIGGKPAGQDAGGEHRGPARIVFAAEADDRRKK